MTLYKRNIVVYHFLNKRVGFIVYILTSYLRYDIKGIVWNNVLLVYSLIQKMGCICSSQRNQ